METKMGEEYEEDSEMEAQAAKSPPEKEAKAVASVKGEKSLVCSSDGEERENPNLPRVDATAATSEPPDRWDYAILQVALTMNGVQSISRAAEVARISLHAAMDIQGKIRGAVVENVQLFCPHCHLPWSMHDDTSGFCPAGTDEVANGGRR